MSIIFLTIVYSAYAVSKWHKFLNITFLLALFGAAVVAGATFIVPLTSIYESL